MAASGYE
jgi:hypothetical protein